MKSLHTLKFGFSTNLIKANGMLGIFIRKHPVKSSVYISAFGKHMHIHMYTFYHQPSLFLSVASEAKMTTNTTFMAEGLTYERIHQ